MISKKVLGPALAGTGAVGASGTLAWTLGLLDEEILDDVVVEERNVVKPDADQKEKDPSLQEASAKQPEAAKETAKEPKNDVPPARAQGVQKAQTGASGGPSGGPNSSRTVIKVNKKFFTEGGGSSSVDRKIIDSSSTWKVEWNDGLGSIVVDVEDGGKENSWKCTLKAITIEGIDSGHIFEEFKRQTEELKGALKKKKNKEQFVANCSYARLDGEKEDGKDSTIELETENAGNWNKFKFKETDKYFERIWSENFYGIDRIKKEDEWLLEKSNAGDWSIKKETGKKAKIEISSGNERWKCHISGDYKDDLETKKFKDNKLKEEILGLHKSVNKIEKKKYLIRNCRKNNWEIKGLKIKVSGSEWWFEDTSLEKIYGGTYENPKEA